jgi:hypothetical protein
VKAAVFDEDTDVEHPAVVVTDVMVTVLLPVAVSSDEGISNVPLLDPMAREAVFPEELLAPLIL